MRLWILTLGCAAICTIPIRAEHATIDLRVIHTNPATGKIQGQATSSADEDPPVGGLKQRPLLKVRINDPLVLQFFYTNTYPHGEVKDVIIRYFVVPEEKIGQKEVPDRSKDVQTEGRFTLNFKLNAKVGARAQFSISKPGIYLLRVESSHTNSDHEHFSAIDLQVE